jgi:hypothetical protein
VLSLFRTNQIYSSPLLFLYALAFQVPLLLLPAAPPVAIADAGILGEVLLGLFAAPKWLNLLVAALLVCVQAVLANVVADRYRLSRTPSQFPGFFLITCWAMVPSFHWLSPTQLGNILLLLGLMSIGRIYKRNEPAVALFNAGAWLALAALTVPSYLVMVVAVVAGVGILRTPSPTNLLRVLVGTFVVFFLVGTYYYFRGWYPELVATQTNSLGLLQLGQEAPAELYGLGIIGLLIVINLFSYGPATQLLNIEGKKNVNILYWVLLVAPLVVLLGGPTLASDAQVALYPLGMLLGLMMGRQSSRRAEFYHFLLGVTAILLMVYRWWAMGG